MKYFIFSGWGEDSVLIPKSSYPHILSLVDKEVSMGIKTERDRHLWISNASKGMSKIHEQNYVKKSFEDPLGIAIHQTFGVGMSLDFDHSSSLRTGEEPSIHRLRARAAKSAIKAYNNIPNDVKSEMITKSQSMSDPAIYAEIDRRQKDLKVKVAELLTLLPSNAPAPEGKELEILSIGRSDLRSTKMDKTPTLEFENDQYRNDVKSQEASFIDPYLNDEIFEDTVYA